MIEPAAVFWDLDGTVCDTEPYWFEAEREMAAAHGHDWTHDDALHIIGWGLLEAASFVRDRIGATMTPEAMVAQMAGSVARRLHGGIPWQPGVRSLVAELTNRGMPQALVTMSYRVIATPVLDVLGFDVSVTGEEVSRAKPHPEVYLRAAELLDVDPTRCIAIEDSRTGSAAANAAGCLVLSVPNLEPVPEAPRRLILPSLDGISMTDLFEVFRTGVVGEVG